MLKMTIDNEEVLSNNDISIKEEILSPSSTILNNVYPKSWELDKDYTSRFYYPKDYSKLNIQNFSIEPEEAGTIIQVNGSATLTDVDTSKESRVLRILGQTSQNGTPTPSSPIPINVVSGDNTINICGKNLINVPNQTITSQVAIENINTKNISGNITLSLDYINNGSVNGVIRLREYGSNTNLKSVVLEANSSGNKSTNLDVSSYNAITIIFQGTASGYNYSISNVMLVKGSTAPNEFEPYIGSSYPIYLGVENLSTMSSMTTTSGGNLNTSTGFWAHVESGKTYTLSLNIASDNTSTGFTDIRCYTATSGGTNQGSITGFNRLNGGGNITKTFTSPYSGYLMFSGSGMLASSEVFTDIKLVEGSTIQHISTTPIELCKIGTYQDYIYKENGSWYLHKEIGKVILNGSESWAKYSGTKRYYLQTEGFFAPSTNNEKALIISNLFTVQTANYTSGATTVDAIALQSDGILLVRYVAYNDETLANFKTWLSTNNITLYYVLSNSTDTLIEDTTLIEQLEALSS